MKRRDEFDVLRVCALGLILLCHFLRSIGSHLLDIPLGCVGNTASQKLAFCEMKYQFIMARSLPEEVTQGTLEGEIVPGDITFFRLQSTSDNILRAYVAQGEVLPVHTRSFGAIGIFAIPEMGRFYRHVLIEGNYPHHGAVAFGHHGKALYEVFKYLGVPVGEIGFNHAANDRYPGENPFC